MTVEESVHFGLSGDQADADWLTNSPRGAGHMHFAEISRMMSPSMFHEMHCIRTIRYTLASGRREGLIASLGHVDHCFDYLRRAILCSADLTLEPGDALERDFTLDRVGMTHECHDWRAMYAVAEANHDIWEDHLRKVLNISKPDAKGSIHSAGM
ncbi:ustYa family protein [Abortiporus biennis]